MQTQFTPRGIYLPDIDFWLDGTADVPATWMSHGHSDHARGQHELVFGTKPTLDVFRLRSWTPDRSQHHFVEYGVPFEFRGARMTAYPASHILGAASLLIEYDGERLLYTGDIKLRQPMLGERTEIPECDRIIIESTFGLPIFHFLDAAEARRRIVSFARECLEDGVTPAFVGYALGRGQEIVHALCEAGIPTMVHGSIARLIPIYEGFGHCFANWVPYAARETKGKALVVVPSFRQALESSGKNIRMAYVSGWASMDNARARTGAEELIPYSDHGDFEELLRIIELSRAREVEVVHGYTQMFCRILSQRGLVARSPGAMAARPEEEDADEDEA